MPKPKNEIIVVINPDGSVYPFDSIFDSDGESDAELVHMIETFLKKKNRRVGTFYKWC